MAYESQHRNVAINISMVSLKWGDVLSILLPGALVLLAIAPYFTVLDSYVKQPPKEISVAFGVALLIAAALAGGVLEAFTRVIWEPWLSRRHRLPDILSKLDTENFPLFEALIQNSYKYATFYANFAWAIALLFLSGVFTGTALCSVINFIFLLTFTLLLRASYIQWKYFVRYAKEMFEKEDVKNAGQLATTGD